jgi:methyltransferase (TIGR00027 family)
MSTTDSPQTSAKAPAPGRLASGKPSRTAEITAQLRASDARLRPRRRLLGDHFARLFVTNRWYRLLRVSPTISLMGLKLFDRTHGGFTAEIVLRTRHFDDELVACYNRGIDQFVVLGAGYDSSALRHPELARATFFEVDHPSTQQAKVDVLRRRGLSTPNVVYVPVDLERGQRLSDALPAAGFDPTRPCLIGWHGVSFFLSPEAFAASLRSMASLCAPSSRLVFDYMDTSVVDGTTTYRGALRGAENVARAGEKYRNGLSAESAAEAALEAGFQTVESLRVTDLVRRYGGAHPYCRDDDFMGLLTVERLG